MRKRILGSLAALAVIVGLGGIVNAAPTPRPQSSSQVTWSTCSQAVGNAPGNKFVCIDLVVTAGPRAYVYTGGTSPSQSGAVAINKNIPNSYWTQWKGTSHWYKGDGDWFSNDAHSTTLQSNGGGAPVIWWTVDYYDDYDINVIDPYFHDVLEWYANSPGYDLVVILK